jgi:hypothetical protein
MNAMDLQANSSDKKRRGRKPKSEDAVEVEDVEQLASTTDKKKRGRRPKSVYSAVEQPQVTVSNTSLSDDENVIVRLHIHEDTIHTINNVNNMSSMNDVDGSDDNPEDPIAYNDGMYSGVMEYQNTLSEDCGNCGHCGHNEIYKEIQCDHHQEDTNDQSLKIVHVLKDFEEKNKNNEWPSNTSICCYWCCHRFDNAPYGIPVNFHSNRFNVYGCFCSLECAAAYNFKSSESLDEIWERFNLLNLLARKIGYGCEPGQDITSQSGCYIVKPAPERLTLKVFGGFLDIDAFRSYHKTNKVVNINFPPMTSLTQQIEEINEYELNSEMKFIPLDSDRINKCKEKIMFKRSKPVHNTKSTLESAMNLKIC